MSYLEDKIYKHQYIKEGQSDCCNAEIYIDVMICSECQDHCDHAPKLCGYCGDELYDEDDDFCSNDCWKGYEHETFRKD
jgi:predicted amidophosphoribosyltransferase